MRKNSTAEKRVLHIPNLFVRLGLAGFALIGLGFFLAPLTIGILNIGNAFGIFCCALLAVFFGCNRYFSRLLGKISISRAGRWILRGLAVLVIAGVLLVAFLSILMIRASASPMSQPETVIVLGCKVNGSTPSLMLVRRLDVAYDYIVRHEKAVVIVTGGQGPDENISEADAERSYLLQKGISGDRIYLEDQSTSTIENLRNAQAIMHTNSWGDTALIATDGFHEYRAQMIADSLGLKAQGLSSATPGWLLPTYWVREWFGIVHEFYAPAQRTVIVPTTGDSSDSAADTTLLPSADLTNGPTTPAVTQTADSPTTVAPTTAAPTPVPTISAADISAMDAETTVDVSQLDEDTIQACFYSKEIPDTVFARINGKSFKEDGQILRSDLRYVRVLHWGPDGVVHIGELIVNQKIADDIVDIFRSLYDADYVIGKMVLIDTYIASDNSTFEENNTADDVSMADNNTSSFNYRVVAGSTSLSNHARGLAIDVNPFYNPWVHTLNGVEMVEPESGAQYADRSLDCPYYINHEDLCYQLFIGHGFTWGGDWNTSKDYQHFQKTS